MKKHRLRIVLKIYFQQTVFPHPYWIQFPFTDNNLLNLYEYTRNSVYGALSETDFKNNLLVYFIL